jgi:hypothetical protein
VANSDWLDIPKFLNWEPIIATSIAKGFSTIPAMVNSSEKREFKITFHAIKSHIIWYPKWRFPRHVLLNKRRSDIIFRCHVFSAIMKNKKCIFLEPMNFSNIAEQKVRRKYLAVAKYFHQRISHLFIRNFVH